MLRGSCGILLFVYTGRQGKINERLFCLGIVWYS